MSVPRGTQRKNFFTKKTPLKDSRLSAYKFWSFPQQITKNIYLLSGQNIHIKERRKFIKNMFFKEFIIFYALTVNFITFITVFLSLYFSLEDFQNFSAVLPTTNFIVLFYSYFSVHKYEHRQTFV
jgi:hypothetical protein